MNLKGILIFFRLAFLVAGALGSSLEFAFADSHLSLFTESSEWTTLVSEDQGLVLENSRKKQIVFLSRIQAPYKAEVFQQVLNKSYFESTKKFLAHNDWKLGFEPRQPEVILGHFNNLKYGQNRFDIPGDQGSATLVSRLWYHDNFVWSLHILHQGRTSLSAMDQDALSDFVMERTLRSDKKNHRASLQFLLRELLQSEKAHAEIGLREVEYKSTEAMNALRPKWAQLSVKECDALEAQGVISADVRERGPRLVEQNISWDNFGLQCTRGAARGTLKHVSDLMFMDRWEKLAKAGNAESTLQCGDYPVQQKGEDANSFYVRTNHWAECDAGATISGSSKLLGHWVIKAGAIAHRFSAEGTLSDTISTGSNIYFEIAQNTFRFSQEATASIAKWQWQKMNTADAIVKMCNEMVGIQCLDAEAQARAKCSCLAATIESAVLLTHGGVEAVKFGKTSFDVLKARKVLNSLSKDGAALKSAVSAGRTAARDAEFRGGTALRRPAQESVPPEHMRPAIRGAKAGTSEPNTVRTVNVPRSTDSRPTFSAERPTPEELGKTPAQKAAQALNGLDGAPVTTVEAVLEPLGFVRVTEPETPITEISEGKHIRFVPEEGKAAGGSVTVAPDGRVVVVDAQTYTPEGAKNPPVRIGQDGPADPATPHTDIPFNTTDRSN